MTPAAAPLLRSLDLEETIIREGCRGYVDPDRLITHAHTRARCLAGEYVQDWRHIRPGRTRPREAMEEAADGINHLAFHIQEHPEDEANPEYLRAIRHFAFAYELVRKAREP